MKASTESGQGTIVEFFDNHGYSLKGYEQITVSSSQYNLSPYLTVLNKRIRIANANILAQNYGTQFIPSLSISGVQFENSSITLSHGVGNVSLDSSVFLDNSSTHQSSKDYYISLNSLYYKYMEASMNPSIKISSNLFYMRSKVFLSDQMKWYSSDRRIEDIPTNVIVSLILEFRENFIANVAIAVISSLRFTLFSENIFLKASNSGVSSTACF